MVQLIKTRPLTDGTGHFGHVIVNGQSINDAMIQAGHAYKRPSMDKTSQQQNPRPSNQSNISSLLGAPGTPPLIGAGDGKNPMMSKPNPVPLLGADMSLQPGPAMMGNTMFGSRDRHLRAPNDAAGSRQIKQMSPGYVRALDKRRY